MKTTFLQNIYTETESRVQERKRRLSTETLRAMITHSNQEQAPFEELFIKRPAVIAEVKRSSPSLGILNESIDSSTLAKKYIEAGAVAVSVLTEPNYFQGSLEDFQNVRKNNPTIPLLQKDFMMSDYQIYEAKKLGASCVLLIVAFLEKRVLKELYVLACSLGLSVIVEIHHQDEIETAILLGAKMIGVNNRNLHDLSISLETSRKLIQLIPDEVIVISESGISKAEEICELVGLGYDGLLIGSSLMKEKSPEVALQRLLLKN